MTNRPDLYQSITDQIIAELEKGTAPWHKPWSADHLAGNITRPLRHNGVPYRGINVFLLWLAADSKGYSAPFWMTYRQAQELGGCVRKGEKATGIVYASTFSKTEQAEEGGEEEERKIPFLKNYSVFNVEQIEGLPAHYYATEPAKISPADKDANAEAFFAKLPATVRHGGNQAYYNISQDFIQMPSFESFKTPAAYYATRGHESAHWTRHPTRLNREFGRKRFGDEGYAMEELVAEISAAYLCADLGLPPAIRHDHAPYLASWLKVLKNDKWAIFTAAAYAQRAVDFLHGWGAADAGDVAEAAA